MGCGSSKALNVSATADIIEIAKKATEALVKESVVSVEKIDEIKMMADVAIEAAVNASEKAVEAAVDAADKVKDIAAETTEKVKEEVDHLRQTSDEIVRNAVEQLENRDVVEADKLQDAVREAVTRQVREAVGITQEKL